MGLKYNKLTEEDGVELKEMIKDAENDELLGSFAPESSDAVSLESDTSDERLNGGNIDELAAGASAGLGGSGQTGSTNNGVAFTQQQAQQQRSEQGIDDEREDSDAEEQDLENQAPVVRLTRTQRALKVLHGLIPVRQTYERLSNGLTTGRMQSNVPGRFIGQGTDGVFRNLMAKPDTNSDGVMKETVPPSYEEAAADATPEYWSSVIAPVYEDEVFVEGLPVGNVANFVWNGLVTVAFQFVGFLLCYLLHTSHAAKHGSRAGLGVTFIFYGWNLVPSNFGSSNELPAKYEPKNPSEPLVDHNLGDVDVDKYVSDLFSSHPQDPVSNTPYMAYGLIAFGLLMIFKAIVDYFRVKRMEQAILHPPNSSPMAPVEGESSSSQE